MNFWEIIEPEAFSMSTSYDIDRYTIEPTGSRCTSEYLNRSTDKRSPTLLRLHCHLFQNRTSARLSHRARSRLRPARLPWAGGIPFRQALISRGDAHRSSPDLLHWKTFVTYVRRLRAVLPEAQTPCTRWRSGTRNVLWLVSPIERCTRAGRTTISDVARTPDPWRVPTPSLCRGGRRTRRQGIPRSSQQNFNQKSDTYGRTIN